MPLHVNTSAVGNIFSNCNLELLDMSAVMSDNFTLYYFIYVADYLSAGPDLHWPHMTMEVQGGF